MSSESQPLLQLQLLTVLVRSHSSFLLVFTTCTCPQLSHSETLCVKSSCLFRNDEIPERRQWSEVCHRSSVRFRLCSTWYHGMEYKLKCWWGQRALVFRGQRSEVRGMEMELVFGYLVFYHPKISSLISVLERLWFHMLKWNPHRFSSSILIHTHRIKYQRGGAAGGICSLSSWRSGGHRSSPRAAPPSSDKHQKPE